MAQMEFAEFRSCLKGVNFRRTQERKKELGAIFFEIEPHVENRPERLKEALDNCGFPNTPTSKAIEKFSEGKGHENYFFAIYYLIHTEYWETEYPKRADRAVFGRETTFEIEFGRPVKGSDEAPKIAPQLNLSLGSERNEFFHYSQRAVRVFGRENERKTLHAFVDDEPGFKWMQLAGRGGLGKSRLALELVYRLRKTKIWNAGFIDRDELERFKHSWQTWHPTRPTLIVVDYVLPVVEEFGILLRTLSQRDDIGTVPVRLLIVERLAWYSDVVSDRFAGQKKSRIHTNKPNEFSYWFNRIVDAHYNMTNTVTNAQATPGEIVLSGLDDQSLLEIVHTASNVPTTPDQDSVILNTLRNLDANGTPLFALLYAKTIANSGKLTGWSKTELLDDALKRNRNILKKEYYSIRENDNSINRAERVAILATMVRGLDVIQLKSEEFSDFNISEELELAAAINDRSFIGVDEEKNNWVPPMEPDILGEWFVLSNIKKKPELLSLINFAYRYDPNSFADFTVRCVNDFGHLEQVSELVDTAIADKNSQEYGKAGFIERISDIYYSVVSRIIIYVETRNFQELVDKLYTPIFIFLYPIYLLAMCEIDEESDGPKLSALAGDIDFGRWFHKRDHNKASKILILAARKGDSDAAFAVAERYAKGLGLPNSAEKCLWYLRRATELGSIEACVVLSSAYSSNELGNDHKKSIETAKWFLKNWEDRLPPWAKVRLISIVAENSQPIWCCKEFLSTIDVAMVRDLAVGLMPSAVILLLIMSSLDLIEDDRSSLFLLLYRANAYAPDSELKYFLMRCYEEGFGTDKSPDLAAKIKLELVQDALR